MDMEAVGNDAAKTVGVRQGSPHHARVAAIELAHGVEDMGKGAGASCERFGRVAITRFGVAKADEHALRRQFTDQRRLHSVGCQRQHNATAIEAGKPGHIVLRHLTDEALRVRALALAIEKWSLDMNAEHAGDFLRPCGTHRIECLVQHARCIGDDGRQQTGGAEVAMRLERWPAPCRPSAHH